MTKHSRRFTSAKINVLLPYSAKVSGAAASAAIKGLRAAQYDHMGHKEYQTYEGWKKACRKFHPDCTFRGDRDIGGAVVDGKDIGEWDGAVGVIFSNKRKSSLSKRKGQTLRMFGKYTVEKGPLAGQTVFVSIDPATGNLYHFDEGSARYIWVGRKTTAQQDFVDRDSGDLIENSYQVRPTIAVEPIGPATKKLKPVPNPNGKITDRFNPIPIKASLALQCAMTEMSDPSKR